MHGFILTRLEHFVTETFGAGAWEQIREKAGKPGRVYVNLLEYSDEEVQALVAAASEVAGLSPAEVLEAYGKSLGPELVRIYRPLLSDGWRTLEVLENTEDTIHEVVRRRNRRAAPPFLSTRRSGPQEVTLVYNSPRKMCALARGIALGLAEHFEERVEVAEDSCMHRGDEECVMRVRAAGAGAS
ncbi:MAG: heme NO-binding domain-containing protein [Thermoanaerobaculia bacterium]